MVFGRNDLLLDLQVCKTYCDFIIFQKHSTQTCSPAHNATACHAVNRFHSKQNQNNKIHVVFGRNDLFLDLQTYKTYCDFCNVSRSIHSTYTNLPACAVNNRLQSSQQILSGIYEYIGPHPGGGEITTARFARYISVLLALRRFSSLAKQKDFS